jgi:hypothetical protein
MPTTPAHRTGLSRYSAAILLIPLLVALAILFASLSSAQSLTVSPPFSTDRLMAHIRTLSSNEFQGRGPGTKGEELTIAYLEKQYRDAGLEPGNPDGTYLQAVPLVGTRPARIWRSLLPGMARR